MMEVEVSSDGFAESRVLAVWFFVRSRALAIYTLIEMKAELVFAI